MNTPSIRNETEAPQHPGVPAPFAKLFDTAHGQLLAFLDETDEGDPAITVMAAHVNDVQPKAKLSGWPDGEEGQCRAFSALTQAMAEQQAEALRSMAGNLSKVRGETA